MKQVKASDRTLDATGLLCPEPVFRARQALADMDSGQVLELRADDPLVEIDMAVFCRRTGHEMLESGQVDGCWTFLVRKTAE